MKIIRNATGGVFVGYQEVANARPKMQPCFMMPHGGEQLIPAVTFRFEAEANAALAKLKKMGHNVYLVDLGN